MATLHEAATADYLQAGRYRARPAKKKKRPGCLPLAAAVLALALVLTGCAAIGTVTAATRTPTITPTVTLLPFPTARPTGTPTHAENLRTVAATLTPSACVVANTYGEALNIRADPSMDAPILGGLLPGQRLHILAWGENWYAVEVGELRGFVSSDYCLVE